MHLDLALMATFPDVRTRQQRWGASLFLEPFSGHHGSPQGRKAGGSARETGSSLTRGPLGAIKMLLQEEKDRTASLPRK